MKIGDLALIDDGSLLRGKAHVTDVAGGGSRRNC